MCVYVCVMVVRYMDTVVAYLRTLFLRSATRKSAKLDASGAYSGVCVCVCVCVCRAGTTTYGFGMQIHTHAPHQGAHTAMHVKARGRTMPNTMEKAMLKPVWSSCAARACSACTPTPTHIRILIREYVCVRAPHRDVESVEVWVEGMSLTTVRGRGAFSIVMLPPLTNAA